MDITKDLSLDLNQIERSLYSRSLSDLIRLLSYYETLERVWNLIEISYGNSELTLAVAARSSGLSQNHLNVLLRKTCGLTFYQLLTRYRILK
ncbi:MAG: hypothetical protein ACREGC_02720, partial [Minisyncoccia bacterium]